MTTLTSWLLSKKRYTQSEGEDTGGADYIDSDMVGDSPVKLGFLFTVEFEKRADINLNILGSADLEKMQYDLKSASRPSITINQEDVNYYGYRTKVSTRMNYGTIQLVFYEDALNRSSSLLWKYINEISPISNTQISPLSTSKETNIPEEHKTIGPIGRTGADARDGIFKSLTLHHHYPVSQGRGRTVYTCFNPKLESATYSDFDMTHSEASTITLTFTIDGCNTRHFIETGDSIIERLGPV